MRFALCFLAAALVGCGSTTKNTNDAGADTGTAACTDKNPDGECYPVDNQGFSARMGSIPGNRVPQMCFQGYKNLNPAMQTPSMGPLEKICLSDFYNPKGKQPWSIIRIIGSSYWCGPCRQEAEFLHMSGTQEAVMKGALLITAIFDEQAGSPASELTLQKWNMETKLNTTTVLDPRAQQLGVFGQAGAVPWGVVIDARSMEVLARDPGFNGGTKFLEEIDTWVNWTKSNPPQ